MKQQTTFITTKIARILSCFLILLLGGGTFYGQTKQYATVTPSSGQEKKGTGLGIPGAWNTTDDNNAGQVVDPGNAGDNNDDSYAELNAGMRVVLGSGFYGQSWIQMKYDHTVPAYTPSYIRLGELGKEGGGSMF